MTVMCDARLIYGRGWISWVFKCGGTLTINAERFIRDLCTGTCLVLWPPGGSGQ